MAFYRSDPPRPLNTSISKLPLELKSQICELLDTEDVCSMRCMSRDWASAGTPGLFGDGIISLRPHLDDMSRLEGVSSRPFIARHITHVKVFLGDMNQSWLDDTLDTLVPPNDSRRTELDKLVHDLDSHRQKFCDEDMLSKAFSKLPKVNSLSILSSVHPFKESQSITGVIYGTMRRQSLRTIEGFGNPPLTTYRYSNILRAAKYFKSPIEKLEIDSLPLSFFSPATLVPGWPDSSPVEPRERFVDNFQNLFTDVRDLTVSITPHGLSPKWIEDSEKIIRQFGRFFVSMANLESLDVRWMILRMKRFEYFPYLVHCEQIWNGFFYDAFWPNLQALRLCEETPMPHHLLEPFLLRHASSLRCLHLDDFNIGDNGRPPCHRVKGLLTTLRNGMNLEKMQLIAIPYDLHDGNEYTNAWENCSDPSLCLPITDVKLLEGYVRGLISWPMESEGPVAYDPRRQKDEWPGQWVRSQDFEETSTPSTEQHR